MLKNFKMTRNLSSIKFIGFFCFPLVLFACNESENDTDDTLDILVKKDSLIEPESKAPSVPKYRHNDTGILYGGDYPFGVNDSCTGIVDPNHTWSKDENFESLSYHGQDCELGRDTEFPNNDDGFAGLSYQKIAQDGKPLKPTATEWVCVEDKVTGLMWEVKSIGDNITGNGGLHDADNRYTWYSNNWDQNGGHVGKWGRGGNLCSDYVDGDPKTYCNTESFIAQVNQVELCGYSDWRLPTVAELSGLINYGATEPSVDVNYFPNTHNAPFWSSSLIASSNEQARIVNFRFGQVSSSMREEPYRIRLVRTAR